MPPTIATGNVAAWIQTRHVGVRSLCAPTAPASMSGSSGSEAPSDATSERGVRRVTFRAYAHARGSVERVTGGRSNEGRGPLYRLYAGRLRRRLRPETVPHHIAMMIDGNRRWARQLGYDSAAHGHRAGAAKLREFLRSEEHTSNSSH